MVSTGKVDVKAAGLWPIWVKPMMPNEIIASISIHAKTRPLDRKIGQ